MSAVVLLLAAVPVFAESPSPKGPADSGATSITRPTIEVISQQLGVARPPREVHVIFVWVIPARPPEMRG